MGMVLLMPHEVLEGDDLKVLGMRLVTWEKSIYDHHELHMLDELHARRSQEMYLD